MYSAVVYARAIGYGTLNCQIGRNWVHRIFFSVLTEYSQKNINWIYFMACPIFCLLKGKQRGLDDLDSRGKSNKDQSKMR